MMQEAPLPTHDQDMDTDRGDFDLGPFGTYRPKGRGADFPRNTGDGAPVKLDSAAEADTPTDPEQNILPSDARGG